MTWLFILHCSWDTAGQERFKCIAASYYRGANGKMEANAHLPWQLVKLLPICNKMAQRSKLICSFIYYITIIHDYVRRKHIWSKHLKIVVLTIFLAYRGVCCWYCSVHVHKFMYNLVQWKRKVLNVGCFISSPALWKSEDTSKMYVVGYMSNHVRKKENNIPEANYIGPWLKWGDLGGANFRRNRAFANL